MEIKLGILASGALGFTCLKTITERYAVNFVFTDKGSQSIIELCDKKNIQMFIGNPRASKANGFLKNNPCDLLLSINYLFVVDEDVISHPALYAINFHGSLLPKYRGRTPHVWAIINNEMETGITAHLMSPGCDEGDIVHQEKIQIDQQMTSGDVLKIFSEKYPTMIELIIDKVKNQSIKVAKQDHTKATIFGKRTADDGEINWNWQKERIHNWVRAQARPYPGAFSFVDGKKVIIHKVQFSDTGFNADSKNGTIVNSDNWIEVKTPNGVIRLIDYELPEQVIVTKGMFFHEGH